MKRIIQHSVVALLAILVGAASTSRAQVPKSAYMMRLPNNWTVTEDLDHNALLISLQGIANKSAARLYFIYPDDWPFQFTVPVYEYYRDTRNIKYEELTTIEEAVEKLGKHAKGYVVWDQSERTSLIVSFTVAGLEDAIVVSERQIPLMEAAGLTMIEDFRGKFTGQSDIEIYTWAYEQYWDRTSKKYAIWLGGHAPPQMLPGVADWGIYNSAFFSDLSANPEHPEELALHKKILSELDPSAVIFGWHPYHKDTEGQHVSLISSFALRMEGLNTLPNASFSHQIPVTPGYKFKNNHHVKPDEVVIPEDKVYITCIQTDGLGIGAWLKPGRGQIPYAWEVTMNWVWLFPGQMQFFYDTATENDYFIGALTGPGYMYPKPIPRDKHVGLIKEAWGLMKKLDLRVLEMMDYSEGNRYLGNVDVTKEVVDAYYEGMPNAIGFINGYGPAHTNDLRDGKPLLSYDYYLSPTRPESDAVDDLKEVIALNPQRPYFLTMHVRESSDIERVMAILDQVGDDVEIVPLDTYLKMAAAKPTFRIWNLDMAEGDQWRK
ncbi:GxGYxYP domain-containing protein [Bacteroidota bacterium]